MSNSTKKWGDTISKKGEVSRVFCGNIDPKTFECVDLQRRFEKYGEILGIDINNNGFAFIQFDRIEDAQKAVASENQKVLKNRTLEVKMFGKSKKKRDRSRSPMNRKNKRNFPKQENRRFFNQQRDSPNIPNMMKNNMNNQFAPPLNHQQQPGQFANLDSNLSIYNSNMMNNNNSNFNIMPNNPMNDNSINMNLAQPNLEFNKPPTTNQSVPIPNQTAVPLPSNNANELEIIVMNRDQWAYCELLEKRFRQETCLKFIDLVFPHSPEMIQVTLRDLYEKGTLYAVVVNNSSNEQNGTFTLHILHNQTEYSNVSIGDGIQLICQDFIKEIANPDSSYYRQKPENLKKKIQDQLASNNFSLNNPQFKSTVNNMNSDKFGHNQATRPSPDLSRQELLNPNFNLSSNSMTVIDKKLPSNIAYILKTTLEDNSAEFLSITQIDSVIEFYSKEKAKLLSRSNTNLKQNELNSITSSKSLYHNSDNLSSNMNLGNLSTNNLANNLGNTNNLNNQSRELLRNLDIDSRQQLSSATSTVDSSQLLDNPQVKAALNSLIQMGAINTNEQNNHQLQSNQMNTNQMNNNDLTANNYVSSSLNYSNNLNDNKQMNFSNRNDAMSNNFMNFQSNQNKNTFGEMHGQAGQFNKQRPNFYNKDPPSMFRNMKNDFRPRQSRFN